MSNLAMIPSFDTNTFFKQGQRVHIHLSTDFPDYVGVMHKHEFIEIVYILSGSAVHYVGDKSYIVNCGDVVMINSGVAHNFKSTEKNETFIAYDLMFTPDFIDYNAISMSDFQSLKNSFLFNSLFPEEQSYLPDLHVKNKSFSDYGEIFSRIYKEYKNGEKGFTQIIRAYCIELIIKIFRDLDKDAENNVSDENISLIHSAMNYIEENYNMKLYVSEIASNIFLSPDYFRKLFKKVTGIPVSKFQQLIRIDKACQLLLTTDDSVEKICFAVGYSDLKTFYQAFKKEKGKTPVEYRKLK